MTRQLFEVDPNLPDLPRNGHMKGRTGRPRGRPKGSVGRFKITPRMKELSVQWVREHGMNRGALATYLHVAKQTLDQHILIDQEWDDALDQARCDYLKVLEDEAFRRAVDGVEDFKIGPDGAMVPIKKYSDFLLAKMLKKNDPEGYSERLHVQQDVTVTAQIGFDQLSPESQLQILQIIERESARLGVDEPQVPAGPKALPPASVQDADFEVDEGPTDELEQPEA